MTNTQPKKEPKLDLESRDAGSATSMPRMCRGACAVFREESEGTNSHLRLHIP